MTQIINDLFVQCIYLTCASLWTLFNHSPTDLDKQITSYWFCNNRQNTLIDTTLFSILQLFSNLFSVVQLFARHFFTYLVFIILLMSLWTVDAMQGKSKIPQKALLVNVNLFSSGFRGCLGQIELIIKVRLDARWKILLPSTQNPYNLLHLFSRLS